MTPASEPAQVLVVDDNEALVENLAEILADAGHRVRTATSAASALAHGDDHLDVALVDLRLPDGDGRALAKRLKEAHPGAEIIHLTGNATVESAAESVRAGAFAYLLKPCATDQLLLTIDQAMRQVRLRREKADLSRRTLVAEKLAAIGTLTAGLSHEIRNPLNAAALQLNVLERRLAKLPAELAPPLLEPLLLVRDEIRRLDHILNDFLQFARPVPLSAKPVPLGPLVERMVALERPDADQRGIKLTLSCSGDVTVDGDEARLQQVFVNLLLNAMDATPRGGSVQVACRVQGEEASVMIRDTGSGISPEALPHVFEPFFTTKARGSGLGLPIVHAIVTQHGGTIRIENSPGGGAQVTIRLPRRLAS